MLVNLMPTNEDLIQHTDEEKPKKCVQVLEYILDDVYRTYGGTFISS